MSPIKLGILGFYKWPTGLTLIIYSQTLYIDPLSFTLFQLLDAFRFRTTSSFFCWGLIPSLVTIYPRYYVLALAKVHFFRLTFQPTSMSIPRIWSNLCRWSSQVLLEITSRSSRYTLTNSSSSIREDISVWNVLGAQNVPIGDLLQEYLPQGNTTIHISWANGSNSMWKCSMFRSIADTYWNPAMDSCRFFILGVGKGALSNIWLTFLKPDTNLTVPFFFWMIKEGREYLVVGFSLKAPIFISLYTSFFNVS